LEATGLISSIYQAVIYIDAGRKGFATRRKAEEGRIFYEKGIAEAMRNLEITAYMLYIIGMTAKEIAKIFEEHGWVLDRIKGSHHTYVKEGCRPIPIPFHGGNSDLGILGKRILKEAGITG
jgi:predicted RNA binding protein YcfA (HicA-like mRNA interferase family)